MPLRIPPAANYPSSLQALPSFAQDEPREGRRQIAAEVLWATMGGADKCVSFNLENQGTRGWSQTSTLKVDNSACGADVTFLFPDTQETIVIPAGSPLQVAPIYSNSTVFYVLCANATPEDITRFIALNYADDPASIEFSEAASRPAFVNMDCLNAPSSVNLVAAGINGTLRSLTWYYAQVFGFNPNVSPNTSQGDFKLADGTGQVIINSYRVAAYFAATPNQYSVPLLSLPDINVRFRDGLIITFTPVFGWGTGNLRLNAFGTYTQP
jgi:hypothetical protein